MTIRLARPFRVLAPALSLAFAAPALADCPSTCATPSVVESGEPASVCWTEGSYQYSRPNYLESVLVMQDLGRGVISNHVYAYLVPGGLTVTVYDEFEVQNLPAGTDVPITLRLPLNYSCVNAGGATVTLSSALAGTATWHQSGSSAGQAIPTLPLPVKAGSPFLVRIEFHLLADADALLGGSVESASCDVDATFSFTGLPPGARIASCRGYNYDTVPTNRTTWSRLKAAYH